MARIPMDSASGSSRLLHLLHLASPALPIGAFHFSQGLEYAVEAGWVQDEGSALEWIEGVACHGIGTLDLPILVRMCRAHLARDLQTARQWSLTLLAARETEEIRAEDRHMGNALARILVDLGICEPDIVNERDTATYAAMFARACAVWSIAEADSVQTYAWAWAETQTLAAVKLVPLGQSSGQRILHALIPTLERLSVRALEMPDEDIGTATVMQAFASARHESQYTRLFRS